MKKTHIIILYGGVSPEHDVSLLSASSILQNLNYQKYHITLIKISKNGQWISQPEMLKRDFPQLRRPESDFHFAGTPAWDFFTQTAEKSVSQHSIDAIFPILHGTGGEDGTLQGFLELLNLPCVGSGCASSALCMDKGLAKKILIYHGLPVVPFVELFRHQWQENSGKTDWPKLPFPFPVFVKPADSGSSIGVNKVAQRKNLAQALDAAFSVSSKILIEPAISGKETEIAVLGNEYPKASIPGEIVPSHEFYDYEDKYLDGQAQLLIPARLSQNAVEQMQDIALKAFAALQCKGLARIDFFVTNEEKIFINEINTLPGFTTISMYPKLWISMGYQYSQLIDELIQLAMQVHHFQ